MEQYHFHGIEPGRVCPLEELVPYVKRQVISLSAIERQHSPSLQEERLAFFSFDAGNGISRDIQHLDILYYVIDGSGEILVEDRATPLCEGACILVPANAPHEIRAITQLRLLQLSVC